MTDLITEVYSTLSYILEEIANNVNNISTKYLPALISNVSPTLLFYIGISLVIFIVCIYPERKSVKNKPLRKKGTIFWLAWGDSVGTEGVRGTLF